VYAVEDKLAGSVLPGSRLLVPLRGGKGIGICVAKDVAAPPRGKVKSVLAAPDAEPVLNQEMMALCRWMSEYYVTPLGFCLRAAIPAALASANALQPPRKHRRVAVISEQIPTLLQRDKAFSRAPQQRALFELLERLGGQAPVEQLRTLLPYAPSVLRGLVQRGFVSVEDEEVRRDPFFGRDPGPPQLHSPAREQANAIGAILAGEPGSVFLLHGVTGSGKTLVYIEVLRRALAEGKTGIVLVPEIALTPQTVDRFRGVFGNDVAVLHSALSDAERHDAWVSLKRGERRIAVGARSAIFAPLERIGVVVLDEEHEGTYKQNEAPRYHAREVAIVRARAAGAVVILGSATPSLESWFNAATQKYHLLSLPHRVAGASLPVVQVVDLRVRARNARVHDGEMAGTNFAAVFTPELEDAVGDCLDNDEQCILLLNRRGHSSFLQCRNCSEVIACPNCSISLTYHSVTERLVCHYCGHGEAATRVCRACGGETVRLRGVGTQQVERLLSERFPAARIARMDMDTTGEKWAHARILDRVASGEVNILLGTQMIAKGLDFPGITLVGVVDADVGLNLPDFRAAERTFQLVSQVAGRAGRGSRGGRVIIQTRAPQHHAIRRAMQQDFSSFARDELESRAEPGYPPFVRLANVLFSGLQEKQTAALAGEASDWIRRLLSTSRTSVVMVGPAPCPLERIKSRWRWHVLLKSTSPADLTRVLRYFGERYAAPERGGLRIALDRDPVSLL
jgi:primosomal protein N' (replication factor Y)